MERLFSDEAHLMDKPGFFSLPDPNQHGEFLLSAFVTADGKAKAGFGGSGVQDGEICRRILTEEITKHRLCLRAVIRYPIGADGDVDG